MTTVKANSGNSNYQTTIATATNFILSDENVINGGKDKGFSPHELLASALSSCTCITLKMYAQRKQWKLEEVNVQVNLENDTKQNILNITTKIELIGDLTLEQKERLLQIANLCPVHKALINPINIQTELQ